MDVIPLDASLVKGSHGRIPDDPSKGPLLITEQANLLDDGELAATGVHDLILRHLGVPRPRGGGAMTTVGRKADHLRIAAGQDVAHAGGTGFERSGCATARCRSATSPTSRSRPSCWARGSARR